MYSAIERALIPCTCKDRRGANASNVTCLRVSLGEEVRQHEIAMCDFCLRDTFLH